MTAWKILLATILSALGVVLLAALAPLAGSAPSFIPPALWALKIRFSRSIFEYHGVITAELAGAAVVCLCAGLYFWLSEPAVIRLKYRAKKTPPA